MFRDFKVMPYDSLPSSVGCTVQCRFPWCGAAWVLQYWEGHAAWKIECLALCLLDKHFNSYLYQFGLWGSIFNKRVHVFCKLSRHFVNKIHEKVLKRKGLWGPIWKTVVTGGLLDSPLRVRSKLIILTPPFNFPLVQMKEIPQAKQLSELLIFSFLLLNFDVVMSVSTVKNLLFIYIL